MIRVERGVRLFGITILLLSSAPNVAAAGFPILTHLSLLSPPAQLVFGHPYYIITLAVLWPFAGSIITLRARDPFRAMVASCVYLVLVIVQFTVTWFAFVAPIRELFRLLPAQ